ncbi:MAG: glycosyltransferase, partial [Lachnospiraceae bacterium]|nr:glycosyltransferase [Lachnospiraceae bacterium]
MKEKKLLSIIVPCYNEEENVGEFYKAVRELDPFFDERGLDTEILYIDDGSSDRTVDEVRKLRAADESVRLVSFSRNFGKEAAIYAGLQKSR